MFRAIQPGAPAPGSNRIVPAVRQHDGTGRPAQPTGGPRSGCARGIPGKTRAWRRPAARSTASRRATGRTDCHKPSETRWRRGPTAQPSSENAGTGMSVAPAAPGWPAINPRQNEHGLPERRDPRRTPSFQCIALPMKKAISSHKPSVASSEVPAADLPCDAAPQTDVSSAHKTMFPPCSMSSTTQFADLSRPHRAAVFQCGGNKKSGWLGLLRPVRNCTPPCISDSRPHRAHLRRHSLHPWRGACDGGNCAVCAPVVSPVGQCRSNGVAGGGAEYGSRRAAVRRSALKFSSCAPAMFAAVS